MAQHRIIAKRIALFTACYSVFFLLHAIYDDNYEFILYSFVLLFLLLALTYIYRRVELSTWIVVPLSLFGFLHLLGGNWHINGVRLYDIPFFGGVIHFDNVVHTIGVFIVTVILYNLLFPFIDQRVKDRYIIFYFLIILMALGIGSVNDIIELIAVLFFNASKGVGNYLNNAFDIVFNALGATLAVTVIHVSLAKQRKLKLLGEISKE